MKAILFVAWVIAALCIWRMSVAHNNRALFRSLQVTWEPWAMIVGLALVLIGLVGLAP